MRSPGCFRLLAALTALALASSCSCSGRRIDPAELHAAAPEVRASAVRKLVKATGDEFAALVTASEDPSAMVRLAAIEVLPTALHPRAVDVLGNLLADPSREVQAAAARAIARCVSPKALPHLLAAYARRGAFARSAIVSALGTLGVPAARPIEAEAHTLWDRNLAGLQSESVAERVGAAEELGRSGRPEAVEKLKPLLGDTSVLLAAAAARGLGAAGDGRVRPLLEPLLGEQYPQLRDAAAEALGDLGDPAAGPALASAAAGPSPAALGAAMALVRLPRSAALACSAALEARLSSAAQILAGAAAGGTCDASVLTARIVAGGEDAAPALAAAAGLKAKAALEPALRIALDETRSSDLRALALGAVAAAGGEEEASRVMEFLPSLLERYQRGRQEWVKDPQPQVFAQGFAPADASAAPLAAQAPLEPARFELVPDLAPGTVPLLSAALEAAGRLHGSGSAEALLPLLSAPDPEVRRAAAVGLAALGRSAPLARTAIEDPNEEVQVAAVAALASIEGSAAALTAVVTRGKGEARSRAIRALGERGEATAAEVIRAAWKQDALPAAATALGALHATAAVADLEAPLSGNGLAGRAEVIAALGALGDPSARSLLESELLHDRPEIRAAAARALGLLHDAGARPVLEALAAEDYYLEVRQAASDALGALGPKEASR